MQSTNIAQAASRADWEKVRQLVERGDDVNVVGRWTRRTGLHYAAFAGNVAICELLLKSGANISATDEDGDQPLHEAARGNEAAACELLVAHGADVTAVNKECQTPLMKAVDSYSWLSDSSAVPCRRLITNDSVNVEDCDGNHALHITSRRSNIVAVQLLVDCGADTNAVNKDGQTPLHTAAGGEKDCPELCEILLKHSSKINAVDEDGIQPLHLACKEYHTKTVKVMVSHGADVNTVNKHGQTPLHTTAGGWNDCPELCEILLKHNARINAVDKDGNQPLHEACKRGHSKTGSLFVSYSADVSAVNRKGHSPLHLLGQCVKDSKRVVCGGESGLHIAVRHGMTVTVQLLVVCGANTNAVNKHGQTPLHTAAGGENDCPELCEIFLKHDARINAVDKDGNQPLHVACKQGHCKTGSLFVSYGADVSAVNRVGHSPLHLLSQCVKNSKSVVGGEASGLDIAARHGMTVTVQLLVDCGADTNAVNKDGQTPLHTAAGGEKDCPELCEILLECDAQTNAVDEDGKQLLHLAGNGAKVNAVDDNGGTSLQIALQSGKLKTAELLLTNGADFKVSNGCGETVLHLLCKGCVDGNELCEDLISHGVSPHLADQEGNLPLYIALKNELPKTSCLLFKQLGSFTLDDLQKVNTQNRSALLCSAVNSCDTENCRKLLDIDVNPNTPNTIDLDLLPDLELPDVASIHPLHIAVAKNNSELCHLLLDHGANVNVQMRTHCIASRFHLAQPLHLAVELGFINVCRLLIERDALIDAETEKGKSPLHLAIVGNRNDIARLLLSYNAVLDFTLERSARRGTQSVAQLLRDSGAFPDEIVSQGESALQIYLSSCSEGTAVTVFLRVDVVGRDGAGKTSLTKSLTLQEFDPNELSTRGVAFDPKCQIIVKEACDWTTPLTSEHYKDMYDKNLAVIMADRLDTPEVKDKYFRSKEEERPSRKKRGWPRSRVLERSTSAKKITNKTTVTDCPPLEKIDISSVDVSNGTEHHATVFPEDRMNVQQPNGELDSVVKLYTKQPCQGKFLVTMSDSYSDMSTPQITSTAFPFSNSSMSSASSLCTKAQSSMDAYQQAVSMSMTAIDELEEEAVGHVGAQETGEKSSAILPHRNRCPITDTTTESAVVVQQRDQHTKTSTKDKSKKRKKKKIQTPVALGQESKAATGPKEAIATADPSTAVQQYAQRFNVTQKNKRKAKAAVPSSLMSENTVEPMTERLPEKVQKGVKIFLRDKESLKKAQKEMMVTVLDYAGQHVFYATHHLCLSKAGFYYVVFDASQPLDGKTPSVFRVSKGEIVHIPLFDNETNFDRLLEWMSAIHIMEPDHSHRITLFDDIGIASPAMFLVGTHADKLREQPGQLQRQDESMRNKLEGTGLAEHIIWASKDRMCFYVDNTLTNPKSGTVDPQVCLLRQMTEEVARKVAQHHHLPLTWLKFEQEVRDVKVQDETKKTVSVEELLHLAKKAAGIKTKEEFEVLLHYLSNRALLLYHPKALKSGEEEVVLDVEWLISQLEKVVTIHTGVPPKFKNDVTRTVQKGIMTASLLRYLLSESGSAQRLIVCLMNHFDLLCRYAGFDADELGRADKEQDFLCLNGLEEDTLIDDIQTEHSDYFIPCLLEKASPLKSQQMDATLKTMPLLMSSAPLRIPRPLFYRVLTHLCKRFRRLPDLYSNVGYFHISPDHRLEFSLNRYSFQFVILSETQMPPRSIVCGCARDYIVTTVEKLKLEGMSGLQLHTGFQLTGTCLSDDFISLDGFPEQRLELYNSKKQQVEHPPELLMWYPQLKQHGELEVIYPDSPIGSGSVTDGFSYSTPVQDLVGCTPSQCIVEMSKVLDRRDAMEDDWRRLWSELLNRPLNEEVVSHKKEGPTQFLLKLWCRMKPLSQATVRHLIQALNSIYRNDVARIVEKYCKKLPVHLVSDDTAGTCDASMSVCSSQYASLSEDTACSSGVECVVTTGADSERTKAQIDVMSPTHLLGDDTAAIHGGNGVCGNRDISRKPSMSSGVTACSSVTSSTLISHLLTGSQPHECLLKIAAMMDKEDAMGDDWRKLWTELVKRPLDELVVKNQPEGPTIYTLKVWVRGGKQSEATVGRLIKALSNVYRNDAAEVLEEYARIQASSDDTSTKDGNGHAMDTHPSFHSADSHSKQQQKPPLHPLSDDTAGTPDGNVSVCDSQDVSRESSLSEDTACPSDLPSVVTTDAKSEVTEAQLYAVSKVAGDKWMEVGLSLGFKLVELYEYEERYPKSLQRRLLRLLGDWRKEQEYPTVEDILLACQKAGVGGDVKRALESSQFS